jgi:uncharacterized protein YdhG (YjbR/CyaY superfamily)
MKKPSTIDEYIATFPAEIQSKLQLLRAAVKKAAPQAEEVISYSMPAFRLHGTLVFFAAHTNHIGFYPHGSGIEDFKEQLSGYKLSKGTVQFPFEEPLPLALIAKIVQFRVAENLQRAKEKKKQA